MAALEKLKSDFTTAKTKGILLAEELAMRIFIYKVSINDYLPGVWQAVEQKNEKPLQQLLTIYPEATSGCFH